MPDFDVFLSHERLRADQSEAWRAAHERLYRQRAAAVDGLRRAGTMDQLPRGLLTRARLFGDREALVGARRLIEKHGYHRRDQELADVELALGVNPDPCQT